MSAHSFDVSGAMVVFKLEPVGYQAFKDVLEAEGWGSSCPNPRTDYSALVNAVSHVDGGKNRKIIPRKKSKVNGVELMVVERDAVRNSYTTSYGAKVVNGQRIEGDYGYADEYKLTDEFLKSKAILTSTAMGNALKDVIARLHGQTGFCRPGIYYIPEQSLVKWGSLVLSLTQISPDSKIESYRAAMDAGTARAIRDALNREVQEEAATLLDDVLKGTLNDDQVSVRVDRAQALLDKLEVYSSILNEGLEGLKNVALVAKSTAAAAMMHDFAQAGV
jgi:hypothetical protein